MTEKCDFCNDPSPHWDYPCKDFVISDHFEDFESVDSWLACDACHMLIQEDRWEELAVRCMGKLSFTLIEALYIHAMFRAHRQGQAVKFGTS